MQKSQDILHAIVKSENEAPIPTNYDCRKECTGFHGPFEVINRKCLAKCLSKNSEAPQDDYSQEPTPTNISNILIDIRDNFYDLANNFHNFADSVSVL